VIYIFCLLPVGNRRLNTCVVLSKVTAVPVHVANFIIKSTPTLIPNLFEGTVQQHLIAVILKHMV
jgi:hypothetical protein